MVNNSKILPKLYILSIGTSYFTHLDRDDQLNYPAVDARDFAKAFKSMEGKIFSEVHIKILARGSGTEPTASNIEDSLQFLSLAGQYDVTILFLAGHGIRDNKGRYFFVPEDVRKEASGGLRRSTLVSWRDIQDSLDFPATRLVFIDTCYSASFFKESSFRAIDNESIVDQLKDQGVIVFASSTNNEKSIEEKKWGHGAFTHALLTGLVNHRANLIQGDNGRITIKELDTFISSEVPRITNGKQHPVSFAPKGYRDFTIWHAGGFR